MRSIKILSIIFLINTGLSGCKTEKEPIRYGTDVCEHCKMLAMDPRFGAELITAKGKIFKFDDINCLITFMSDAKINPGEVAEVYVIDYSQPQVLVDAKIALYVQSDFIKSPMASGVAAFTDSESRYKQQQSWQGIELNWEEVNSKFK